MPSNSLSVAEGDAFKVKFDNKNISSDTTKKKPNTPHVPLGNTVVYCCNAYIATANNKA